MTRDEVLERLRSVRAEFDARVAAIPADALEVAPAGFRHSPKEVVAHVNAYERLIVDRLRAARRGEQTALGRDREGWEAFNASVWARVAALDPMKVLADSKQVFSDLVAEVSLLDDGELTTTAGVTEYIDPAWLDGHELWELIGTDGFEHYPMHFDLLEAAALEAVAGDGEDKAGASEGPAQ